MPKVLTFGKAYRVHRGSSMIALALPVHGRMRLVRWVSGRRVSYPVDGAQAMVLEPGVDWLILKWGITAGVLDAFVERHVYRGHTDVVSVRNNPLRRVKCRSE